MEVAGRAVFFARSTPMSVDTNSHFTGTERELQLWPLLPAGEWKSWEISGRGASSRRLSFQWTRWLSGGKDDSFLSSFGGIFFIYLF